MTPFYMSTAAPDEAHGWRGRVMKTLPPYIAATEKMAGEFDALLVRPHEMFQRQLKLHRRGRILQRARASERDRPPADRARVAQGGWVVGDRTGGIVLVVVSSW